MALSKTQELVQKALKDPCIFGVILHSEGDYWTRQMTESQLKTQALYQKFV
jgi:hypothetical protein